MDSREKREMCNSNDSNDSKRRKYARCATRMTRKTRNAGRIRDFEQGTRITAESEGPIETSSSSQTAGITKEMARNHQGPAYQQSIPLYRQELEWKKIGIPLSRTTLTATSRAPRRGPATERDHPAKLQMNHPSSTAYAEELF